MEQLKFKHLIALYLRLCKKYNAEVVQEMPVYLGDDDELNGVHCGWCCDLLDAKSKDEDDIYLVEMINETAGNFELKDKAILIS